MKKKSLTTFLKKQKSLTGYYLHLAIGLGLTAGFLLILQAYYLAHVIHAVVFDKASFVDVAHWLYPMLGVFIIRALLAWVSEQTAFRAAMQVKRQLRADLHQHLQALGPVYLKGERSGEIVNTLVDGIEGLQDYYAKFLPTMSLVVLVPLAILVFIFPIDWLSGLIMLGTAPLIPFFMILIGKGTESLNKKQWRKLARMSAHFLDMIQGLTTLKLFNASRREADVIANIANEYRITTMSVLRVAFLSSLVLEFLATVSIAMVAVTIGFRLFYGQIDFFYGFFVLLLAPEFYLPLRNMGTHYHARMEAIGAAEKIVEVLETSLPEYLPTQSLAKPNHALTIEVNHVSFHYEQGREALNNVSFSLPTNQRIALVGSSGAGKSTITHLLLGFIQPQTGDILINQQPLSSLDPQQWRQQLAWVPQNPHLFHGSIRDNIALGQPNASDEAIQAAAKRAFADGFIAKLPDKYDSLIGERGIGLSGGEIQRIALARAFLKDAPLVILDEATANLDRDSEIAIQRSIDDLAQDRSLLVIAHRLETVKNADCILMMDKGRIVEQGTHNELAQRTGLYHTMLHTFTEETR
jgi:ATP-binding cassette subfamily C protein CydD